jgi:hypothetical protein
MPAAEHLTTVPLATEPMKMDPSASTSEVLLPAAVEDKKSKKKAKKEKKVKEKKIVQANDFSDREKKKSLLFGKVSETSPYTVLLGMTLAALILAGILLFVEWMRYDMDTHATKAKQSLVMNQPTAALFAEYFRMESENEIERAI